ncbi:MAG: hypothetical protein Q9208_007570 [Pyrenodesmia sp. 3 TL-2023]
MTTPILSTPFQDFKDLIRVFLEPEELSGMAIEELDRHLKDFCPTYTAKITVCRRFVEDITDDAGMMQVNTWDFAQQVRHHRRKLPYETRAFLMNHVMKIRHQSEFVAPADQDVVGIKSVSDEPVVALRRSPSDSGEGEVVALVSSKAIPLAAVPRQATRSYDEEAMSRDMRHVSIEPVRVKKEADWTDDPRAMSAPLAEQHQQFAHQVEDLQPVDSLRTVRATSITVPGELLRSGLRDMRHPSQEAAVRIIVRSQK